MVSDRKNLNIVDSIDKDKQKIYKTNKKIRQREFVGGFFWLFSLFLLSILLSYCLSFIVAI
jgi:hypothetical protein